MGGSGQARDGRRGRKDNSVWLKIALGWASVSLPTLIADGDIGDHLLSHGCGGNVLERAAALDRVDHGAERLVVEFAAAGSAHDLVGEDGAVGGDHDLYFGAPLQVVGHVARDRAGHAAAVEAGAAVGIVEAARRGAALRLGVRPVLEKAGDRVVVADGLGCRLEPSLAPPG